MRKYIAEFIGTAVLVIFGCGSAVAANALFSAMGMLPAAFTTLLTAFAFGLSVIAMVYAIGHISGAHINPAVSLAMLISKRMNVKDFAGYVIAQFIGGIAGAGLLAVFLGGTTSVGANGYGTLSTFGIAVGNAFLMEVVMTFVFVFVVLGVTDRVENKGVAGLVIGFTLTMVYIFGVPFTGTSVNPARSLGPAIVQGGDALKQVWVFILAPVIGAVIAAVIYRFLNEEPKVKAVKGLEEEVADEIADMIEAGKIEILEGDNACEDEEDAVEVEEVEETVEAVDQEAVPEINQSSR